MYTTTPRYQIKCLECGNIFYSLGHDHDCPHCGEKHPDIEHIGITEIEVKVNRLTGEVTAY